MAEVTITEFTDPGCPWAWSAEPFRWRLLWLYGDRIDWDVKLVGLSSSPEEYAEKGMTPEKIARGQRRIAREHGMPFDASPRSRLQATLPSCQAVVGARVFRPESTRPLLRRLRIRGFAGGLLDDPQLIDESATDVGLDPAELREWMRSPEVGRELAEDMEAARRPLPAARVLDHKLANWSGGRRYTCPSYEIKRLSDGVTISVPGFQPFASYDLVLANLVPGSDRCEAPESVEEVLRWAATPLASQEVASVCEIDRDEAREQLVRVADEQHVGQDGLWQLRA